MSVGLSAEYTTVEVVAPGGRLKGTVVGDPGVLRGTVGLVANVAGAPVNGLGAGGASSVVIDAQVEVIG